MSRAAGDATPAERRRVLDGDEARLPASVRSGVWRCAASGSDQAPYRQAGGRMVIAVRGTSIVLRDAPYESVGADGAWGDRGVSK